MKSTDSRRSSHATPHKSPNISKAFYSGSELDNRWIVLQSIGKGAFSEILAARDTHPTEDMKDKPFVAIKIQTACLDRSVLKWEAAVVKDLSGHPYFPKYFSFHESISPDDPEYIVMEYLCGEDMSTIRNRARTRSSTGLVPLCLASYLVRDMLRGLKEMHLRGYVHRDVKPSNFVRRDDKTTKFCVIDFGLTKMYRDNSGAIRPEKSHADFRGTTVYASPFVHDGFDQCPRDDLISVLHVFFDMIIGKLPWGDAARSKDKVVAAATKRHMYSNPNEFINWLCEEVSSKSHVGLEQNFSVKTRNLSLRVIEYLKSLTYGSVPDYDWLDTQFAEMVPENQRQNVADVSFEYEGFNWHETSSRSATFMTTAMSSQQLQHFPLYGSSVVGVDIQAEENNLQSQVPSTFVTMNTAPIYVQQAIDPNALKMKTYGTSLEKLLRESTATIVSSSSSIRNSSNNSNMQGMTIDGRKEIFKMALRWANVMKLVLLLPITSMTVDVLDIALRIARRHQHFFGAYIEDDMPDRWEEFCQWQQMIGDTYSVYQQLTSTLISNQGLQNDNIAVEGGGGAQKRSLADIEGVEDNHVNSNDGKRPRL